MRRPLVLLLVWFSGVALATVTGLLAVRLVAAQVGDASVPVLSLADVERALAATAPPVEPALPPGASGSPVSAAASEPVTFSVVGGTVSAVCTGTTATLVYATPEQGFQLEERSAQGTRLEVRFRGASSRSRLTVDCSTGTPVEQERRVDADGGDSGDDGGTVGTSGRSSSGDSRGTSGGSGTTSGRSGGTSGSSGGTSGSSGSSSGGSGSGSSGRSGGDDSSSSSDDSSSGRGGSDDGSAGSDDSSGRSGGGSDGGGSDGGGSDDSSSGRSSSGGSGGSGKGGGGDDSGGDD